MDKRLHEYFSLFVNREELRHTIQTSAEYGVKKLSLDFNEIAPLAQEDMKELEQHIRAINDMTNPRYINQIPAPIERLEIKKGKLVLHYGQP